MSRSITALTPKTLTNETIEDLIDNLSLSSLDLSGGTLNLSGTTTIGTANNLSTLLLTVGTINELNAGDDINIRNLTTGNIFIESTNGQVGITGAGGSIGVNTTAPFMNNFGGGGDIEIDAITGATAAIKQTIFRIGGSLTNAKSQNAGQNTFTLNRLHRITSGSYFVGNFVANFGVAVLNINYGIVFSGIPNIIATTSSSSGGSVSVSTFNETTSNFSVRLQEVGGAAVNNISVQWIAIGFVF